MLQWSHSCKDLCYHVFVKLQMWTKPCSQKPSEMKLFQNNFQTETILHAHDLSPLTPEPYTRQL